MARPVKFARVAEKLQERIAAGAYPAGAPMPSETALADEFGVNRLTLRKALDVLADDQWVVRRHGLGTFARPAAESGGSTATGVVYVGESQSHFFSNCYASLCEEAERAGDLLTVCLPRTEEQLAALRDLLERQPRLVCMHSEWWRIRDSVPAGTRVTIVSGFHAVRRMAEDAAAGSVLSTDTRQAAELAVDHLVALGHRRIAYVDVGGTTTSGHRLGFPTKNHPPYVGYLEALHRAGIDRPYPIGIVDPPRGMEVDEQTWMCEALDAYFATCEAMPTAYVCVGDFRAVAVYRALRSRGLSVPQDASVVGMGDTPWSQFLDPQLTSVCLGEGELARVAMQLTSQSGQASARLLRIDPDLVVRHSTGPCGQP